LEGTGGAVVTAAVVAADVWPADDVWVTEVVGATDVRGADEVVGNAVEVIADDVEGNIEVLEKMVKICPVVALLVKTVL
jgi:hypothetical protein